MIDVTRALRSGHPIWVGDAKVEILVDARIRDGSSVNVGSLRTGLHVGTHVDAPWHYDDAGVRLGGLGLDRWVGEALVVDVRGAAPTVAADALATAVADALAGAADADPLPARLLLHTGQADDWGETFPEFRAIEPDAIAWAAARGVRLIGTDAPSVDAVDSKDLPTHAACAAHDVAILEGLALAKVAPGRYELLCLPLSLPDADGSPARAVLRPWPPG
jgi:arylformamidase